MLESKARNLVTGDTLLITATGETVTVADTEQFKGTLLVLCTDGKEYHPAQLSFPKQDI